MLIPHFAYKLTPPYTPACLTPFRDSKVSPVPPQICGRDSNIIMKFIVCVTACVKDHDDLLHKV